jgi:hypothetical protein
VCLPKSLWRGNECGEKGKRKNGISWGGRRGKGGWEIRIG